MRVGNLKLYTIIFLIFFKAGSLNGEEKINLNILQPTFEEEAETTEAQIEEKSIIKSKKNQSNFGSESVVKIRALDKITAKTSDFRLAVGEKKFFGALEIKALKCQMSEGADVSDTVAYLQVKDLSAKDNNQVFLFNGWTFASSPTLQSIDHPVYDLWITSCENI